MRNNVSGLEPLHEEEVEVTPIVEEEHCMQLFLLAKTMYDMDKFKCNEIEAVVNALAWEMGSTCRR
jgi:hypothetical protein